MLFRSSFGRAHYFAQLENAGLTPEQIQKSGQLLKQLLRSDLPSIASRYAIAPQKLEGLLANYQEAYTAGITQMLSLLVVLLLLSALGIAFGLKPVRTHS